MTETEDIRRVWDTQPDPPVRMHSVNRIKRQLRENPTPLLTMLMREYDLNEEQAWSAYKELMN